MIVELHNQEGLVGEITLSAAGRAVGLNGAAQSTIEDTKIFEPGDPPTLLTPEDGERYLRAMPFALAGSYFWAELVE